MKRGTSEGGGCSVPARLYSAGAPFHPHRASHVAQPHSDLPNFCCTRNTRKLCLQLASRHGKDLEVMVAVVVVVVVVVVAVGGSK